MFDHDMSAAWREAGAQLGVRVSAPHSLSLPSGGTLEVEAFLPDFGGPDGVVVVPLSDDIRCRLAADTKHFVSSLGPSYERFDGKLFRETLDDWAWFGNPDGRPRWHTGKPWS